MQKIINKDLQDKLITSSALKKLGRIELGEELGLTAVTIRKLLDTDTPFVVSPKTFTAVNNFLIEELSKK